MLWLLNHDNSKSCVVVNKLVSKQQDIRARGNMEGNECTPCACRFPVKFGPLPHIHVITLGEYT